MCLRYRVTWTETNGMLRGRAMDILEPVAHGLACPQRRMGGRQHPQRPFVGPDEQASWFTVSPSNRSASPPQTFLAPAPPGLIPIVHKTGNQSYHLT